MGIDSQSFPARDGQVRRGYPALWVHRLAYVLDTLNTLVVRPEVAAEEQRVLFSDVRYRDSANWSRPVTEAYDIIKNLHYTLGFDNEAAGGVWLDVPILDKRGTKRRHRNTQMPGVDHQTIDDIVDIAAVPN